MQQRPRHIVAYAAEFCKGFRATQRRNFSLLCWALFRKRTTVLSELARCFSRPCALEGRRENSLDAGHHCIVLLRLRSHIHRLKRIWRFLSNPRFNFQAAMDAICMHTLFMALKAGARKVVLVDITGKLGAPAAALVWRGRAVLLCM